VTFIWYGGLLVALGGTLAIIGRVSSDLRRRRGEAVDEDNAEWEAV